MKGARVEVVWVKTLSANRVTVHDWRRDDRRWWQTRCGILTYRRLGQPDGFFVGHMVNVHLLKPEVVYPCRRCFR